MSSGYSIFWTRLLGIVVVVRNQFNWPIKTNFWSSYILIGYIYTWLYTYIYTKKKVTICNFKQLFILFFFKFLTICLCARWKIKSNLWRVLTVLSLALLASPRRFTNIRVIRIQLQPRVTQRGSHSTTIKCILQQGSTVIILLICILLLKSGILVL